MERVNTRNMESNNRDFEIGTAGEHLVCCDLITKGYNTFQSGYGLHYDLVADVNGKMLRIQVKTCRKPGLVDKEKSKSPGYIYHIRRMGKKNRKKYEEKDLDVFALVGLDKKIVAYIPNKNIPVTLLLREEPSENTNKFSRYFKDYTFEKAIKEVLDDKN